MPEVDLRDSTPCGSTLNEEGSCIVISRILTSGGLDLRDSTPCESTLRRNVRIESNRKVPQTNRLSLGVLDMDEVRR